MSLRVNKTCPISKEEVICRKIWGAHGRPQGAGEQRVHYLSSYYGVGTWVLGVLSEWGKKIWGSCQETESLQWLWELLFGW